jgi:rubrerythrin
MEGNATVPPIQFKLELSPRELLELALWLERCGVEFYRFLAEEQSREKLRGFYL